LGELYIFLVSYGFISPFLFLGREKLLLDTIRYNFQFLSAYFIENGFNNNIEINGKIEQSKNKVDILICNHMSILDMFLINAVLYKNKISNYFFIGKNEIIYYPGFGVSFMFDNHIKLMRNWEEDKLTIYNQIAKIKEGMIVLFPEGTRLNEEKFKEGNIFSKENNLPVYKNLLVPRSKGFIEIYQNLKKLDKLGKIYDFTLILEDFNTKNLYFTELLKKNKINTKIIINNFKPDENDLKKWLLDHWVNKDKIIENFKKYKFIKLNNDFDKNLLILHIIIIAQFIYLFYDNDKFKIYYIGIIVATYVLIFIKKNNMKKLKK
jgi:1-acyl-sn-glycerol-3-phosphate acyltransferase